MKKYLFAIAMVLSLSMNADAAAQKHRHSPRTEQVDSTKNNRDAIEAFSDTTAVAGDSIDAYSNSRHVSVYADDDVDGFMEQVFGSMDGKAFTGIIIVLGTLFILFVLFPIIIIIAVIYFINRNRKDRIKLAQMALLKEKQASWDRSDYQTGLRQMFTGVGLAIFLGIVAGKVGFGIGALVFFIGLGKWFIARQSGNVGNDSHFNNTTDVSNNTNNSGL